MFCAQSSEELKNLSQHAAVSDSPYPKEAFSIGEEQDGENTVEGPDKLEDMDECRIYEGNICDHICVNTQGSYRCECYPGYVLQADAFTCAQGNEEDHQPCSLAGASRHLRQQEKELWVPFAL